MNSPNPMKPIDANPDTDVCFILPQEYVSHVQPFSWVSKAVPEAALKFLDEKPLPPGWVLLLFRVEATMGMSGLRLVFRRLELKGGMQVVMMTTDFVSRIAESLKKETKK